MAGKLTVRKVKSLTGPGRYGDGNGLWLQVRDAEHRSWLLRYTVSGRSRQMGLGALADVSLAEAREAAAAARRLLRQGSDPVNQRRAEKAAKRDAGDGMTFRQVVERYLTAHEAGWRNEKHKYQWRQTLGNASEGFGIRPVGSIATADVMRVIEPIWHTKPETASRLRGRIEAVLDYAGARNWREGENPARWRGHLPKLLPSTSKIVQVQHHAALPWRRISAFLSELRAEEGVATAALDFTILTAARTGETIGATWLEIDADAAVWTIPPHRMKSGRERRVPLTAAALAALTRVLGLRNDKAGGWVFPGNRKGNPLSNMAMVMLLRRMGHGDITVHGFRSAFRDWAGETTAHPREVVEAALAHRTGDKVEQAYARGDLFTKRRKLMEDWAAFCDSAPADVVSIGRTG